SRRTLSEVSAGVRRTRWSGASGSASKLGEQAAPQISLRFGLTGNTLPAKRKRLRLSQTRRDQWSARSDGPTMTAVRGWNRRSMASFLLAEVMVQDDAICTGSLTLSVRPRESGDPES